MLHADKLAFEANLAQDLVAIQMKELGPFGRGAERPDSAERERRREALGQPTSRRAPPKSKKNVKLDVEMGGANATL